MKVRLRSDQSVISLAEFKLMHPNTSWPQDYAITPAMIAQFSDADAVYTADPPIVDDLRLQVVAAPLVWNETAKAWYEVWTVENIPAAKALQNKTTLIAQLQAAVRDQRDLLGLTGGYKVTIDSVDKWFHSDVISRSQQLALVEDARTVLSAGGNMQTPFTNSYTGSSLMWKTMDKSFVAMTPELALRVKAAAVKQAMALFSYSEQLQANIAQASDPNTIDIYSGWPETYITGV
jgi:Domain of unknown function (DUF4376)